MELPYIFKYPMKAALSSDCTNNLRSNSLWWEMGSHLETKCAICCFGSPKLLNIMNHNWMNPWGKGIKSTYTRYGRDILWAQSTSLSLECYIILAIIHLRAIIVYGVTPKLTIGGWSCIGGSIGGGMYVVLEVGYTDKTPLYILPIYLGVFRLLVE